jgi:FixJ family two-component response regulator
MSDLPPVIYVVDDDPSVCTALERFLKTAGWRAQSFASAEEFLARPRDDGPACLILDQCLPGLSGLGLQRALAERDPGLPVVFLTSHGDIPMSVRAMKAGAADFLTKPFREEEILSVVGQALARSARAQGERAEADEIRRRAEALSPREREVLSLVVRGLLNKQAGRALGVTEGTIKVHRARVMRKMRARSLADLVRMAVRL